MNNIYANNQEVTDFITKAQNKIADLATLLRERAGDIDPLNTLALELIEFIETLDNPLTNWTLEDVLRWIHEYQYRANLGEISYLNIYGYNTTLITGVVGTGNITSSSITDFELEVNKLIRKFPHNSLALIQGGTSTQRYHLTKEMYDYLNNLVNPNTPSTVELALTTDGVLWPSGYYELGTSISVVNLSGSINYGTERLATYFEYLKNGVLLGSRNSNPTVNLQPNPISDTTIINGDTSYSFRASFTDGLKIVTKNIQFRQPMYYGIVKRSLLGQETIQDFITKKATKDVRDRGQIELSFTIPVGNTSLDYAQSSTPFLFIPDSWGKFTSAIVSTFDFASDWSVTNQVMELEDGTNRPGLLITYDTQIEGLTTFKFNW